MLRCLYVLSVFDCCFWLCLACFACGFCIWYCCVGLRLCVLFGRNDDNSVYQTRVSDFQWTRNAFFVWPTFLLCFLSVCLVFDCIAFDTCVVKMQIGDDITIEQLRSSYHGVVLAYGAGQTTLHNKQTNNAQTQTASDRTLQIPGHELKGIHSARSFVNWYNAHPTYVQVCCVLFLVWWLLFSNTNISLCRQTQPSLLGALSLSLCSHAHTNTKTTGKAMSLLMSHAC